jgi:thiamine biosynthesis lipoprotein
MGTTVRVTLYAPSPAGAESAARAAFAEIAALDARMSDYRPESELSLLSASSGAGPTAVSQPLFEVLSAALRYAELSGGAFDVTVGPLLRLWRGARKTKTMPSPEELREARHRVGFRHVALDPHDRSVTLRRPGMLLDLGGIAKGYACDRALAVLRAQGVTRALVDTGGGMAAGDPPPGERGWRIRVGDRDALVLVLARCGVSTSGDTEQFVELDGRRYSHIVDPSTGLGLVDGPEVTVVAPDGMSADALSTAISVMGVERGLKLAEDLENTEAWILWKDGETCRISESSGFPALLERQK